MVVVGVVPVVVVVTDPEYHPYDTQPELQAAEVETAHATQVVPEV